MKNSLQVALSFLFLACSFPALHAQESTGYYGMDKIQEVRISFVQDNWAYLLDSLRFNGDGLLDLATSEWTGTPPATGSHNRLLQGSAASPGHFVDVTRQ